MSGEVPELQPDSQDMQSARDAYPQATAQQIPPAEASGSASRALHLTKALLWRAGHEQGIRLMVMPLAFAGVLLVLNLVVFYVPGILTSATRYALERQAAMYFSSLPGSAGLAMAFLLVQGPYLMALFAGILGASIAQSSIGNEAARGGFELLLGTVYKVGEVFVAFLLTSFVLTLVGWFVLALGTLGVAAIVLLLMQIHFHLPASYIVLVTVIPLPLALLANLGALLLGLIFPRLIQLRTGSTNVLQLLAMLPALALFILINVRPDLDLGKVAAAALGLGIVGSVCGIVLLQRRFRPELILES